MARPSTAAQRSLTLTEELERLEQSITLTLQEIDHNFSRAHRIVTSSILPVVEQYAEHSRDVWEGSKFWKQFFEASANVSLNGYEENEDEDEETDLTGQDASADGATDEDDQTITTDGGDADLLSDSAAATPASARSGTSSFMETPGQAAQAYEHSDAPPSPTPTPGSETPKPARKGRVGATAARQTKQATTTPSGTTTPKRRKGKPGAPPQSPSPSTPPSSTFPSTPRAQTHADQASPSGTTTPDLPSYAQSPHRTPGTSRRGNDDVLLHRVLDKNYRVQATPLSRQRQLFGASRQQQGAYASHGGQQPETPAGNRTAAPDLDLDSSPMEEAPTIRAGLLPVSPAVRGKRVSGGGRADWEAQRTRDRVPGVSVLETSKKAPRVSLGKAARQSIGAAAGTTGATLGYGTGAGGVGGGGWVSDSDEDDGGFMGMSPPKTMAFNVPTTMAASRLMRTPARQASKMIVEDLLATAGGENLTEELDSPSVVGKAINFEEDTF